MYDCRLHLDSEVTSIVAGSGEFSAEGHNHLGQTWTGSNNPLSFQGSQFGAALLEQHRQRWTPDRSRQNDDGIQMNSVRLRRFYVVNTWVVCRKQAGMVSMILNGSGNGVHAGTDHPKIYPRNGSTRISDSYSGFCVRYLGGAQYSW